MNIPLTEELEEFVRRKVESGRYSSATEVIRAGFRLLEREDELRDTRLAAIRARVGEGIEQAERGERNSVTAKKPLPGSRNALPPRDGAAENEPGLRSRSQSGPPLHA